MNPNREDKAPAEPPAGGFGSAEASPSPPVFEAGTIIGAYKLLQ